MKGMGGNVSRRDFLNQAAYGLAGTLAALRMAKAADTQPAVAVPSRVAFTQGPSRADNVFRSLKSIEGHIAEGIARKKKVVIKPNMVVVDKQLSATHADCLEGILEFLKPLVREEVIVAESPAGGSAEEGYSNYNYHRLEKKYRVRFVDLDQEPVVAGHVVNERYHAKPVRLSQYLLDPDVYLISAAVMKTHDRAVTTLALKNIVFGAILKDQGFRWGRGGKGITDKPIAHGGPQNEGIHYNLFQLSKRLHPDLAIVDGYEGMEGNGPVAGTPVDHKVAVASTDWLAADRVAVELMGIEFRRVGYLTFCAQAGMGQADLGRIEILGPRVADHIRQYRPHDNIEQQYKWM